MKDDGLYDETKDRVAEMLRLMQRGCSLSSRRQTNRSQSVGSIDQGPGQTICSIGGWREDAGGD